MSVLRKIAIASDTDVRLYAIKKVSAMNPNAVRKMLLGILGGGALAGTGLIGAKSMLEPAELEPDEMVGLDEDEQALLDGYDRYLREESDINLEEGVKSDTVVPPVKSNITPDPKENFTPKTDTFPGDMDYSGKGVTTDISNHINPKIQQTTVKPWDETEDATDVINKLYEDATGKTEGPIDVDVTDARQTIQDLYDINTGKSYPSSGEPITYQGIPNLSAQNPAGLTAEENDFYTKMLEGMPSDLELDEEDLFDLQNLAKEQAKRAPKPSFFEY